MDVRHRIAGKGSGLRGFHDAVNVHLGKPAQYPDDLKGLAQFVHQAITKAGMQQELDYRVVDIQPTEEDKRREAAIQKLFLEAVAA